MRGAWPAMESCTYLVGEVNCLVEGHAHLISILGVQVPVLGHLPVDVLLHGGTVVLPDARSPTVGVNIAVISKEKMA